MLDRKTIVALAVAGLSLNTPIARCFAQATQVPSHTEMEKHDDHDDDHDEDDDRGDKKEHRDERKIEQAVPMAFVPPAVLDAVKKEVPTGTITESELEAGRGRIMYSFDVTAGDMKYEVKITVDGKFFSKKVDDEKEEKGDRKHDDKD